MKSVAALILAAGKSARMGQPKSLLRVERKTFLERIVEEAEGAQLSGITIVLGHKANEILEALPQFRHRAVVNTGYELGQLSSLQLGLRTLSPASPDGVMVFLVDHPFVHRQLLNDLIEAFSTHEAPIVVPSFQNRRGHPMIFAASLFDELLRAPLDRGALSVVRKHQDRILHLVVNDPGVLIDIDTPEAYNEFVVLAGKRGGTEDLKSGR